MKKLLFLSLFLSVGAYGAPRNQIGNAEAKKIVMFPYTISQINNLKADTTGQMVLCSDCTQSTICVSSGSVNNGSWVVIAASGPFAGATYSGMPHCR